MIRRINFYGGPCSGKSTTAPYIFSKLKKKHLNVEIVVEYIKEWTYIKRIPRSFDQLLLLGTQINREDAALYGGFDLVVTDSPIFMQAFYAKDFNTPVADEVLNVGLKFEKQYPGLHIWLDRSDNYCEIGRFHTLEQAKEVDTNMLAFLKESCQIPELLRFKCTDEDAIYQAVEDRIKPYFPVS